jgi:SAM-dependent methyltransferase
MRDPSGDAAFYAGLARETGGPILELGCGTGRVLLPIAREGLECVGLDASAAMLAAFRAKGPSPNLTLVEGTMMDYDLGASRFRLIFAAFRVFQHLYTIDDQLAALACARKHLAPGGLLAFDVFAPLLARIALPEEPEHQEVTAFEGEDEIRRFATVWRDHATQVQRVRFRHERWRGGVRVSEEVSEIRMRWYYRFEVEHLLVRAGFEPLAFWGEFDRRPYDAKGEIIAVVRAR